MRGIRCCTHEKKQLLPRFAIPFRGPVGHLPMYRANEWGERGGHTHRRTQEKDESEGHPRRGRGEDEGGLEAVEPSARMGGVVGAGDRGMTDEKAAYPSGQSMDAMTIALLTLTQKQGQGMAARRGTHGQKVDDTARWAPKGWPSHAELCRESVAKVQ